MQVSKYDKGVSATTRAVLALLLVIVIFIVFSQAIHHEFINYDDQAYVTDNSHVKEGLSYRNFVWAFTAFEVSNWHPVTWLSHMLDYEMYGMNPMGHHLTNLILHLANALLLLYLLYKSTGKYWQSLFIAALFGLHPLHVESVAWIAERKDLLSTFLFFMTLIIYGEYVKKPRTPTYLLMLMTYGVGLMAKPMLVTLPLVMLLWDFWPLGRLITQREHRHCPEKIHEGCSSTPPLRLLVEKIPFFLLSLTSCIVTYYAQQRGGAVAAIHGTPPTFRVINALQSYVGYMEKMVWPHDLAVIYPLPPTLTLAWGGVAGLVLLLVSWLVWRQARNYPYLPVGWLWYLCTLVPVIGLIQVGQQAMADRYTYIPLTGLFIMISWGVADLSRKLHYRHEVLAASAVSVLGVLAVCTWIQLGYWKNSVTLFEHAVQAVPNNHIAFRMLGNALSRKGDMDGANRCFAESLRIMPDDDSTHIEWGSAATKERRIGEALYHYNEALRINPGSAIAHYDLGVLLADQGKFEEAIGHFLEALRIEPGRADLQAALGSAYLGEGKTGEAVACYHRALLLEPGSAELNHNLGLALAMQGNLDESIAYLARALEINPGFAEAHYNLGVALIKTGKIDEGIRHFSEALRINPALEAARKSLAAAQKLKKG